MAKVNGAGAAQGALGGAATGAMVGSMAGPIGTGVGAGIGFVAGGLMGSGIFGGERKPWYDEGWFNQRRAAIGQFEQNLAGARARYLTSLGNMYNQAYSRFSGNAEAGFAARGLQVNGGAFASALANKTADYQAQLEPAAFEAEREDLGNVQNLYAGLFSAQTAAKAGQANTMYNTGVQNDRSLGRFVGQLGLMSASAYMNKGAGAGETSAPGHFDPGGNSVPRGDFTTWGQGTGGNFAQGPQWDPAGWRPN